MSKKLDVMGKLQGLKSKFRKASEKDASAELQESDVSNEQHLPNEVKLTRQPFIDGNIELLVEDGQLKGVVKDGKGSPTAEIVYNVNLSKANG